ncbi:hypothetical protein [Streptomyces cavernicola]|uniref:C2H2-type domain-containing protein n=1 Tax=Streptomyces cavernicola TaxID=3043613 RepID=A0ABT6SJE2_9ACTN|nr:hypothetical protein [Streptomyces sp. B-S-A6]MDI3408321.1 hypothetical protein [Streptomyces sp. B-S-A6]
MSGFSWIQVGGGRVQITCNACRERFTAAPYAMQAKIDGHRCGRAIAHVNAGSTGRRR